MGTPQLKKKITVYIKADLQKMGLKDTGQENVENNKSRNGKIKDNRVEISNQFFT